MVMIMELAVVPGTWVAQHLSDPETGDAVNQIVCITTLPKMSLASAVAAPVPTP
jgi:hypothetical protein